MPPTDTAAETRTPVNHDPPTTRDTDGALTA